MVPLESIHEQWHIVPVKTFLEPDIVGKKIDINEDIVDHSVAEKRLDIGLGSPDNVKIQRLVDVMKENRGRADIYERLISGVHHLANHFVEQTRPFSLQTCSCEAESMFHLSSCRTQPTKVPTKRTAG